jgi:hypothetical protein
MLGKKVTGVKKRAETPSLDQAEQKRHKTANQAGKRLVAAGNQVLVAKD